jgi:hypothetical protein
VTEINVSRSLVDWALRAGYDYRPESDGQPPAFFNSGGEERFYLRRSPEVEGWIIVTNASRSGDEQYSFAARDLYVAERYFWELFGFDIRSRERMKRLDIPVSADQVATGFHIDYPARGQSALVDANGDRVMVTSSDVGDIATLVQVSHLLSVTTQELIDSFLDAGGRPAFPIQES